MQLFKQNFDLYNDWPAGVCTITQSANLMKPIEEMDFGGGSSSGIQGLVADPVLPGFTGDHADAQHSKQL